MAVGTNTPFICIDLDRMVGAFEQFETEIRRERQVAGIAAAMAQSVST